MLKSTRWITAFSAALALGLAACAGMDNRPDPRSPEQVVAQASGPMSANDTVTPGSGFGLDGLAYKLIPITNKCHQQQGLLLTNRKRDVSFIDRRKQLGPRTLSLVGIVVCEVNRVPIWAAEVELQNPEYLVAQSIGSGINYYATVATRYVSGEAVIARRQEAQRAEMAKRDADLASQTQCTQLREAYRQRLRAAPRTGMKVAYGMIIDVRGDIALIQYDALGRQVKQKEQEWVQVDSLSPGENCPR